MKILRHLRVVLTHKWHVFWHCACAGIIWRGLVHDLSKFRPSEFCISAKYFQGTRSPVYGEREVSNGFSTIAMTHTKRNRHHWEYWLDYTRGTILVRRIPYKFAVEYVCDILAASKVYMKKKFSFQIVYEYFSSRMNHYTMHPETKEFICQCLLAMQQDGYRALKKKRTKKLYQLLDKLPPVYVIRLDLSDLVYNVE